jgi:hypothetical protein
MRRPVASRLFVCESSVCCVCSPRIAISPMMLLKSMDILAGEGDIQFVLTAGKSSLLWDAPIGRVDDLARRQRRASTARIGYFRFFALTN